MPNHGQNTSTGSSQFYDKYSKRSSPTQKKSIHWLEYLKVTCHAIFLSAVHFINWVIDVTRFGVKEQDLDQLMACVDCGTDFGFFNWRYQCANCNNTFCSSCLTLTHALHNGKERGMIKRRVCSYCYFQLCARHCRGKCCEHLSISSLRSFLNRKGVSMFGAVEKSDLVDRVRSWANDLSEREYHEMLKESV
jgi:hypothetical protein